MRRREVLRSAVGGVGLGGVATVALTAAGKDSTGESLANEPTTRRETKTADGPSTPAPSPTPTPEPTPTPTPTPESGSDSSTLETLSTIEMEGTGRNGFQATEVATTPDGQHAFVSTVGGFKSVDLSDPANPAVVATTDGILADRSGGPMGLLFDLKYNRERLLVASPGSGRAPLQAIALFDVSSPANPSLLNAYETTYSIHNCDLYGRYAYLTTGTELDVIDVGRDKPRSVATWSPVEYDSKWGDVNQGLRNLHDLAIQGDRAYLAYWDAGTWMLDVSDPTNPQHLGHALPYTVDELTGLSRSEVTERFYEPGGNDHYVLPNDDGSILAVGKESWNAEFNGIEADEPESEDNGGPGGIALWDISDPSSPKKRSYIEPPQPPEGENSHRRGGYTTTAHNFDIAGDYLYASWYRGGVSVHDISDPTSPVEVASWEKGYETSMWAAKVAVPGEYFLATSYLDPDEKGEPGGLYVFVDPTNNDATITPAPQSYTTATPTPEPTPESTATPTPSPTPESTPTSSPTPESTATPTPEPTPTSRPESTPRPTPSPTPESTPTSTSAETTTSGSGPGFGPLAALSALGAGAWRALRTGSRETDE